jgi:hypothetical protein
MCRQYIDDRLECISAALPGTLRAGKIKLNPSAQKGFLRNEAKFDGHCHRLILLKQDRNIFGRNIFGFATLFCAPKKGVSKMGSFCRTKPYQIASVNQAHSLVKTLESRERGGFGISESELNICIPIGFTVAFLGLKWWLK